ncbi:hypothetical protein [Flagellimonas hymeniacidonis]|nr:hypothetical protein [Flagellimonas hymeniacidonis]
MNLDQNSSLSRKEVYDLIWSTPITIIIKQYFLSISDIKKICKKYNIPLPERGYWSKIRFGKSVDKVELPDKMSWDKEIQFVNVLNNSAINQLSRKIEIENTSLLVVPKSLRHPDSLISTTALHWQNLKQRDYSLREKSLSIRVSENCRSRSLRFVNALIKLLKVRGHTIETDRFGTYAKVFDIKIKFYLREVDKRIPAKTIYGTSDYVPTGVLALKTNEYSKTKEWRDSKQNPIETKLSKIVARLESDALKEIEWRKEVEAERIIREKERELREKQEQKTEEEIQKFKLLLKDVENYKKAESIRAFLCAKKNKLIKEKSLTLKVNEWLKWAEDKADWLDPLIDKNDDLFGNFKLE